MTISETILLVVLVTILTTGILELIFGKYTIGSKKRIAKEQERLKELVYELNEDIPDGEIIDMIYTVGENELRYRVNGELKKVRYL